MAVGDEYAVEIGRLSIAFARADYYIHGIVIELIDPEQPEVGAALLQGKNAQQVLEFARKLIPLRAEDDERVASLMEPLNDAVARADEVRTVRNRCLHSIWMAFPGQPTATLLNDRRHEEMSLAELQDHVVVAEEAGDVVSDAWERLAHAFGAFDALIAATREMDPGWD